MGHHIPWADLGRELAAGPGETLLLQPRARLRADVTALSGSRALQAPGWDEARALAVAAAEAFTDLATVGWDVAITDARAVPVEANGWWGVSADPDGRLLPVLRALRKAGVTGGARARRPAG